jgi:hypothetical protein
MQTTPPSGIAAQTRELIVQLSRGNRDPARALAERVQTDLNVILSPDSDSALKPQARQTLYAIEEVLTLMEQSDFRGAWEAARDAAKEWRTTSQVQE